MRIGTIRPLVTLTLWATFSSAQDANPVPCSAEAGGCLKRWALTFGGGVPRGGPSKDLERGMVAGGFNSDSVFASLTTRFPFSTDGTRARMVGLTYRIRRRLLIGIQTGGLVKLGETTGHSGAARCCIDGPSTYLILGPSVRTTAALASFEAAGLRVGVGPAWYSVTANQIDVAGLSVVSHRVGFVIEGGMIIGQRSRLFLDLNAQYRGVGSMMAGPLEVQGVGTGTATLPATRLHFNHTMIGFALGLRL